MGVVRRTVIIHSPSLKWWTRLYSQSKSKPYAFAFASHGRKGGTMIIHGPSPLLNVFICRPYHSWSPVSLSVSHLSFRLSFTIKTLSKLTWVVLESKNHGCDCSNGGVWSLSWGRFWCWYWCWCHRLVKVSFKYLKNYLNEVCMRCELMLSPRQVSLLRVRQSEE